MAFPVYTGTYTPFTKHPKTNQSRGIWALIQAQISRIDFDYASYAETRLGEYYAWRREEDRSRSAAGEEMPLRERRWAQEA